MLYFPTPKFSYLSKDCHFQTKAKTCEGNNTSGHLVYGTPPMFQQTIIPDADTVSDAKLLSNKNTVICIWRLHQSFPRIICSWRLCICHLYLQCVSLGLFGIILMKVCVLHRRPVAYARVRLLSKHKVCLHIRRWTYLNWLLPFRNVCWTLLNSCVVFFQRFIALAFWTGF